MSREISFFDLTLAATYARFVRKDEFVLFPDYILAHRAILPRNRTTALKILRSRKISRKPFRSLNFHGMTQANMSRKALRRFWSRRAAAARVLWD